MNDLAEFLLARIKEDEATARAASDIGRSRWRWQTMPTKPNHFLVADPDEGTGLRPTDIMRVAEHHLDVATANHVTRWDPARVLAECEAKRRIVGLHHNILHPPVCAECSYAGDEETRWVDAPCPTLRALALPYADHPDYHQEWRP